MSQTSAPAGVVYLVGAGPGDPGLLTLRGRDCLAAADVVLYDGLVSPLLLRHTRADCERTSRAGPAGGRRLDQAEINARLIAAAQAGQTVVRLKGGDPFLFGRGSEEAAALAAAGIAFEVVPGVTAAIAAADYAGLSLTHRDLASAVAFVTGHEDPGKAGSALDYAALAGFPGTLVFYMGLHRLPEIAAALVAAGKPATTPACVVSRATTPHQRVVEGTLGDVSDAAAAAGLHAPSLIVVGDCVRQREQIAWFERRPLLGLRIGITRPADQADDAADAVLALGGDPIAMPLSAIEPPETWDALDAAIDKIEAFQWLIFTSVNGVASFFDRMWELGWDARRLADINLAVIGPATEAALAKYRLYADVVPEEYNSEGLAEALAPLVGGRRVLWIAADRGRDVLPEQLAAFGAEFEKVVAYRNRDAEALPADAARLLGAGELDWVPLTSPASAKRFAALLPETARPHVGTRVRLASLSPVTTAAAVEAGLPIAVEAAQATWDAVLAAMIAAGPV